MKELNGIYFGANITGAEGGSSTRSTRVACDDLGNNLHYTLAEVDEKGAVMTGDDGRFQRLTIADRKQNGVQVLRDANDNPFLEPGQTLKVEVGSHTLTIEGTGSQGVLLNGANPTKVTRQNELIRYPRRDWQPLK